MKNKKILLLACKLLLQFSLYAQPVELSQKNEAERLTESSFTLAQCIEFALKNSPQIKHAALQVEIDKAKVKEIMADGLPQLNASAGYMNNLKIQTSFLPDFISPAVYGVLLQEGLVTPSDVPTSYAVFPAQFGIKQTARADLIARQLLFDGTYFLGLKAAKTYTQLSEKELAKAKIDLVTNLMKSYYAVLINQERLGLAFANIVRTDSLLRQTRAMYEQGFAEKIDVDRLTVLLNNAQTTYDNLQRAILLNEKLLKFQMGMDLKQNIRLAENLKESKIDATDVQKNTAENTKRIEYSILETQKELAMLDVRRWASGYFPKLFLSGSLGYTAGGQTLSDFRWFDYQMIGFSIDIPLFDGFRKQAQIQQAKLKLRQAENAQTLLKQQIALEEEQAATALVNAFQQLDSQAKNMQLALEVLRVTNIKYQEGVGSILEIVDADAAYRQAENNYYNALYEAIVAKIDYDKATGNIHY